MSGFRHWAFVYRTDEEFANQLVPFIRDGIAADAAVLVALGKDKLALLTQRLGSDAGRVRFQDMHRLGRNPGAIIHAWQEFANANPARPLCGVGEPAWPGRSGAELVECRHHECLLNAAFHDADDFNLVCPYDAGGLDPSVIARISDSHRTIVTAEGAHASETFLSPADASRLLGESLAAAPAAAPAIAFELESLGEVRRVIRVIARGAGLGGDPLEDFVLAVNELAENSVRHGPGNGRLRIWMEGDSLVAEVTDAGRLDDPLIGRRRPGTEDAGGFGMWLTHQVCDLVQVRSAEDGTIVRAHMHAPAALAAV